jgi:hypothetical protein
MAALNDYLTEVQAALSGLDNPVQPAIIEELRGHLEDRTHSLQLQGISREVSMREAIERFGEAGEIGAALRDVHGPGSWGEALAAMLPFLAIGLLMALDPYRSQSASIVVTYAAVLIGLGVPLIGLGVGWVKGFPRWSYPYGGFVLAVASLLLANNLDPWILNRYDVWVNVFRRLPGLADVVFYLMFGRYNMWVLFLAMAAMALLLSRLWRPLRPLHRGAWHDWTRLSFGFYGVMPLVFVLAFYDVSPTPRAPYLVASTVILAAGAVAYVRSSRTWQRTLALLAGMTLFCVVTTAGVATFYHLATWDMIRDWVPLAALMLAPVLLSPLRRQTEVRWAG